MTKDSRHNEDRQNLLLFIIILFLTIVLCSILLLILYYPDISSRYFLTQDSSSVLVSTEEPQYIDTEKVLYDILPGYTYFENRGELKLYADIIPMIDNNLMVTGIQYHNENYTDNLMKDASIKEVFYKQENGSYKNKDNSITVSLIDNTASFKDNRTTVSIPFTGVLELIPEEKIIIEEIGEEVLGDDNIFKDGTVIETTKVDNILVDTYDSSPTPDNYISKDFQKYLNPDNERQDFSFTAKYIETDTNSGVKYQEINSGIYFYTFGSGFPYDSNVCNTVTITATYRGYNKKFNGLNMKDSYPCFVTKSIRKPNKTEITTP